MLSSDISNALCSLTVYIEHLLPGLLSFSKVVINIQTHEKSIFCLYSRQMYLNHNAVGRIICCDKFLFEKYFSCKTWISKFLPVLVLLSWNNFRAVEKLKWIFHYDIEDHFWQPCPIFSIWAFYRSMCNVHVCSTLVLQSGIFSLLKIRKEEKKEEKVLFSFAYLDVSLLMYCLSSQAPFFSEGKKTELLLLSFSLQGLLGYLT